MKFSKYLTIAIISGALLALELAWTRIFSAEFYYTFAFLILSSAILGIGLGGLCLRVFSKLNKEKYFWIFTLLTSAFVLISPILIFQIELNFSKLYISALESLKFALSAIILCSPFFFGGFAVSYLLRNNSKFISRLYMSDLIGAAVGTLLIMILMNWLGTPVATVLIPIPILILSIVAAPKTIKALSTIVLIASIFLSFNSSSLLQLEREDRGEILFTHWDAMSKIRVVEYNSYTRGIRIDNAAQSSVYKFDGNFRTTKFRFDVDVSNLIRQFDSCSFLSLGAGGGIDVLHALQSGAEEVYAVEVNAYINYLLTEGKLADYTGNVYSDPRVKVITEDGRAFVRRSENKFDIIYALSSNSFAALASGAFALAENYLFTVEAFVDYWKALTPNGYMIFEHHFYVPRMLTEAIEAMEELGVENPESHIAVYSMPKLKRKVLLVGKEPLNPNTIQYALGKTNRFRKNFYYPVYPAPDSIYGNLINQIVLQGWENIESEVKIDISPCYDDKPFIAQMGKWKNLSFSGKEKILPFEYFGFPLAKLNVLTILLIVAILIIPLNLIPYFKKDAKIKTAPWLYFFFIGMGFMLVEVVLIQKYTLLIGPSVYGVVTILLTVLLTSGIGSRFSEKFAYKTTFGAIILLILFDAFVSKELIYFFGEYKLFARIIATAVLIAPMGFFMGMPFPKAGGRVGGLIDWGFAVNGAASVFGSALALLIAFDLGLTAALLFGAFFYLIAFALFSAESKWN